MAWVAALRRLCQVKFEYTSRNWLWCNRRRKSYYITTPIFYVNSVPHIGHLYTSTLADAAQRWERLSRHNMPTDISQDDVFFATGTDEHGLKVYGAATKAGLEPLHFCDKVSERFKDMYRTCNIDYRDFIRTTEQRHKTAVTAFWQLLEERGYIYKGFYEGWYSTQDESFVPEKNTILVDDQALQMEVRISQESGHKVEWMKETNYIFKLSSVIDDVKTWVKTDPSCVYPPQFRDLLLDMLESMTGDISVSRERSRVCWGIETPSDSTQLVYVWLDALVNYLTVAGFPDVKSEKFKKLWPADCQIIGMDILKFHGIYWPAFLIAAGLELPKQIVVHCHWLMEKRKMSKSVGNVIDPFKVAESVSGEGLRYFLLRQGVIEHDCDYSNKLLLQAVNSDLCNTLGNCLNRAVAPKLNPDQIFPPFHKDLYPTLCAAKDDDDTCDGSDIIAMVRALPDKVDYHCKSIHFYKATEAIMECVRQANVLVHRNKLWHLDLSDAEEKRLSECCLHCVYETLRVSGILLLPFVPNLAAKLLDRLNVQPEERTLLQAKQSFNSNEIDGQCTITGRQLGPDNGVLVRKIKSSELRTR